MSVSLLKDRLGVITDVMNEVQHVGDSAVFVKRVRSFVHVSISFVCNIFNLVGRNCPRTIFWTNVKYGSSVLNAYNTVASHTNTYR